MVTPAWRDDGARRHEAIPGRRILSLILLASSLLALAGSLYTLWQARSIDRSEPTYHSSPSQSSTPLDSALSLHKPSTPPATGAPRHHWVDSWAAVPHAWDYVILAPKPFKDLDPPFYNTTIRQTVALTLGAAQIRLRLTNAFGLTSLKVGKVHVALPTRDDTLTRGDGILGSGTIDPTTLQEVTFSGSRSITIPEQALVVSDPITFDPPLADGQILTISMYLPEGQVGEHTTTHRLSLVSTYVAPGDQAAEPEISEIEAAHSWFYLGAVEAWKEPTSRALVVLGDSISDGAHSDMNTNMRWPSELFKRMQDTGNPALMGISVVNAGNGGNAILHSARAPAAPARLDRDVLAHSGVKYVLLWEGINDIGHGRGSQALQTAEVTERLISHYRQIILRVHAFGIPIFGGTITPFNCPRNMTGNYGSSPVHEKVRLDVNEWIRNGGWYDAVIDFDAVLRDPLNHTRLDMRYNSGDCLHPSGLGHQKIAANFPLELFEQYNEPVDSYQ